MNWAPRPSPRGHLYIGCVARVPPNDVAYPFRCYRQTTLPPPLSHAMAGSLSPHQPSPHAPPLLPRHSLLPIPDRCQGGWCKTDRRRGATKQRWWDRAEWWPRRFRRWRDSTAIPCGVAVLISYHNFWIAEGSWWRVLGDGSLGRNRAPSRWRRSSCSWQRIRIGRC
jgi:hypothetical protein